MSTSSLFQLEDVRSQLSAEFPGTTYEVGQFQLFRNISSLNSEVAFESSFLSGDMTVGVQTHDS